MKKGLFILAGILSVLSTYGQDVTGTWYGLLKVQDTQLRIVFNIEQADGALKATLDSPDQGAKGVSVDKITIVDSVLTITIAKIRLTYTGKVASLSLIKGTLEQGGLSLPLDLSRKAIAKQITPKAQDPIAPYPYLTQDVTFINPNGGHTLAATLTMPAKGEQFPAVVLISGSGSQDRDEQIMGHRPFLVLSDYLSRHGIAVLRYDDRGAFGSTGDAKTVTTADLSTDAEAAVEYLKTRTQINPHKIGLAGHSEGGIIAPMVAARNKDVAYIILLAGMGIPGDSLLILQNELIGRASGMNEMQLTMANKLNRIVYDIVKQNDNDLTLQVALNYTLTQELTRAGVPQAQVEQMVSSMAGSATSPWVKYFIRHDPAPVLEKVTCPVLALNGEKDLQVPSKENLTAIAQALAKGGNQLVTIHSLPLLNHLFQECTIGLPQEYAKIEQTISPKVLSMIAQWITLTVNSNSK